MFTTTLKRAAALVAPLAIAALAFTAQVADAQMGTILEFEGTVLHEVEMVELHITASPEAAGDWCEIHHENLGPIGGLNLYPGDNVTSVPYAPGTYFAVSDGAGNQWDPQW